MLVLQRNIGEIVQVGDAAVIVLDVSGRKVRLGFQFPTETRIIRSEIAQLNDAARRCLIARDTYRGTVRSFE